MSTRYTRSTCAEQPAGNTGNTSVADPGFLTGSCYQTQGDLLLPPANAQVNIFRSVRHSVHMGGLWSLYDVTSYLATWSHTPSRGLCPWSHIPFGGGGSLSGVSVGEPPPIRKVDGMHPTGTLSCSAKFLLITT